MTMFGDLGQFVLTQAIEVALPKPYLSLGISKNRQFLFYFAENERIRMSFKTFKTCIWCRVVFRVRIRD
jgi:hypothetical protein